MRSSLGKVFVRSLNTSATTAAATAGNSLAWVSQVAPPRVKCVSSLKPAACPQAQAVSPVTRGPVPSIQSTAVSRPCSSRALGPGDAILYCCSFSPQLRSLSVGCIVSQMLRVPGSKVKSIRDRILQVLRVLAVFGLHVLRDTARTRSISRFCTADTANTPSILGSDTAGTPCTRSNWALSTAHTPSYSQYSGRQYSNTRSSRSTKCTRYSEYNRSMEYIRSMCVSF